MQCDEENKHLANNFKNLKSNQIPFNRSRDHSRPEAIHIHISNQNVAIPRAGWMLSWMMKLGYENAPRLVF